MVAAAALSASGGVVALLTIRRDALEEHPGPEAPSVEPAGRECVRTSRADA